MGRPVYTIIAGSNGSGHFVSAEKVISRFQQSYDNLVDLSSRVDELYIIDNSNKEYKKIMDIKDGHIKYLSKDTPKWLMKTCVNVADNSKNRVEEVLKVSAKEFEKLRNNKDIFVNPYSSDYKVLVRNKELIKELTKIFMMER